MTAPLKLQTLQEVLAPVEDMAKAFHRVNRLIPDEQEVCSVSPDTTAGEALELMREHGYSQLPVKEGSSVLGMFSYRAFALEALDPRSKKGDLAALPVVEFLEHETLTFARLTDEFRGLVDLLDQRDAIVVSGPESLIALLTPMDVLRYLYRVAGGFVLVEEIELSVRTLIQFAVGEGDLFRECVEVVLGPRYEQQDRKLPTRLSQLSFDEYIALLRDGRTEAHFTSVFGKNRDRVRGWLEPVRDLRNDIFHFRRELSVEDHQTLTGCRDWLLLRVRMAQARMGGSNDDR